MLKAEAIPPIPKLTGEVADAAFPQGNRYMRLRDAFGEIFVDDQFQSLYPVQGQPAYSPWRLALISVMQYMENLTDRQAADAVRARLDWKYVLSLELKDPGFDFSVLTAFRQRLLKHEAGALLFEQLLEVFNQAGLLKSRGKQRTDSTAIFGLLPNLNRLELIIETLRAALNQFAAIYPNWLAPLIEADWLEHYGRRTDDYRLPKGQRARQELAEKVGADGCKLLEAVERIEVPVDLKQVPALEALRQIWQQEFHSEAESLHWRLDQERPASANLIQSPYEQEARYALKRNLPWIGYKVHLTETCDEDNPHLIVNVKTTIATVPDHNILPILHQDLAEKNLLPAQQLVDGGYTDLDSVLALADAYQVEVIGPLQPNSAWQAKVEGAYQNTDFIFDWDKHVTTCPQGKTTKHWLSFAERGETWIQIRFYKRDCDACPARALCTRAKSEPRYLRIRPDHERMKALKLLEKTEAWKTLYQERAGIEGTISQTMRVTGLRQARYRGLAKTQLQDLLSASAINLIRVDNWLAGEERISERITPFQKLCAACA